MIDILWGYSKDICMISDMVWGKKSQKKDNDIYLQPLMPLMPLMPDASLMLLSCLFNASLMPPLMLLMPPQKPLMPSQIYL